MAARMPLKWVLMGLLVGTAVDSAVSAVTENCDWLTSNSDCIQEIDCQISGIVLRVWEDCQPGSELFTITNDSLSLNGDCEYAVETGKVIQLQKLLDAEDEGLPASCTLQGGSPDTIFFDPLDINESPPYPSLDTLPVMEVTCMENIDPPLEITKIYYSDDDLDETSSLTSELKSTEYEGIFTLEEDDFEEGNNRKSFSFKTNASLDFEDRAFYKVEYSIVSKDGKGTKMTTDHTFFVYVGDEPDNAPFWTQIQPLYELDECQVEDDLFTVTAQDRDVMVNYNIRYSLEGSDYFEIHNTTGTVRKNGKIDREDLLELEISSFSLVIIATEYNITSGEDGEEPNNVEQVSIVTILDCNDETPEFNNDTYVIEMNEVARGTYNQALEVYIVVKDMDEGESGTFTLETNEPTQVKIDPDVGKQTQLVTLTALNSGQDSLFDYEVQGNTSFYIEITATETKDPSHTSTATVTITLRDVNDEEPFFLSDTYRESVKEGSPLNTYILQVEADDSDTSPGFGKPSIRYSLDASCNEVKIDSETGKVTLAVELDYEDKADSNPIECKVTARDMNGSGKEGNTTKIVVTIDDVVDEPPRFVNSGQLQPIMENSKEGSLVDSVTVTDADAGASISFEIVDSSCSGDGTSDGVTGWFKVSEGDPNPPNFPATVEVGSEIIDRELCSEVTLTIQAKDNNTDEEYESESTDTEIFIITILDENDEPPTVECVGSCSGISVNEDDELNSSDDEVEVVVFTVIVTDPDEKDTIQLSLSEGGEFMYLSEEEVSVEAGNEKVVEVRTIPEAIIDREKQDTIEIEIIAMDSQNQTTVLPVSVAINDLNDKKPVINTDLCGGFAQPIDEDDGTGNSNGTFIFTISATDADKESPHNSVTYTLLNDQIPDSKNPWTPFTIDATTGNVTVLLVDNKKALDREQFPYWELIFRVYDECDSSPTCKVQSSEPDCVVNITVLDVNDHDPRDLTWMPDEPMKITDFQKENETLKYVISAQDDDEGENAELTYEVLGTYREGSDTDMGLFRAEDEITTTSSCRLLSTEDFKGKNYTGKYIVILEAKDGGNRSTNFSISIEIEDANDEPPSFVFEGCLHESEANVIKMVENAYKPGEEPVEVKCGGPDGEEFIIDYEDADLMAVNRLVQVQIDTENSTVENLGNGVDMQRLLSYWSLWPDDCDDSSGGCRLRLSHQIDREEGTAYNLSLKIQNTATPQLENWATVRVVVTNEFEFDPYFCKNGHCSQLVYMYENDASVSAVFTEAKDEDNNGVSPGDDEYNTVYYYIVGGDKNYFQTISEVQNEIILKNLPDGLDREDRDEYSLTILATNKPGSGDTDIGDDPRNDTLTLIIKVGDVNDEVPSFSDDVLFASFMESNSKDEWISIIEAIDEDLNETLTYEMHDDLEWFETTFDADDPFRLDWRDNRSVYLTLNFEPTGLTGGYCNFTISVRDKKDHVDETVVKVYVITEDYQVAMYFSNELEEIQSQRNQIEGIYSDVYGFKCTIDSIAQTQSSTGENLPNKTTVYMHFIDEEKNEPVDKKIILDLSDNAGTMIQLMNRLSLIGIKLDSVDTYTPPTNEKNPDETIRELQILLGVVSLVLGLFVLLLATVYWLRTNKLQRKIKVLSTNTFGSKDEGLNQMGLDMMSVPGSNYLAKEHGNHNPVFSESGGVEFEHQDAESISSGDSVLVGVEDNPEFKSYSAKDTLASSSKGLENPSYVRSIDDVSAAPPGVHGGVKGNPLLNLGGLKGDPEPSAPSNDSVYDGDSLGSQDDASVDQNINSNFSFS